ncbi:hypothetical protein QFC20_000545 [Naganishia adeliensis]|uniref:Uncharacterized protein n=1 Tax=Naganishia adeliensis TaxID=92952 RepID=A0ACC2X1I4_9TREE|nr:hypothetical protein QFC20_000545 [Naganishia adeliensis]
MSSSITERKVDHAAAEMLEEPFIRATVKSITKLSANDGSDEARAKGKEEALQKLRAGMERIKGLKRKIEAIQPSPSEPSPLKARLNVLSDLQSMTTVSDSDPEWLKWKDQRLDRFMVDYLLRTGKHSAAASYAKERNIENQVDVALFQECARIGSALVDKQSCTEALAWCGENRGTLKKTKNYLEFSLRLQEYIELCRKKQQTDALAYAQKYLSTWQETHMREIEQTMSLLFFGQGTNVGIYKRMYDPARWQSLRDQFQITFNTIYGIPTQPILSLTASAGMSSLKLAACATGLPHESADGVDVVMESDQADHHNPTSRALVLSIPSLASSPPIHDDSLTIDPSIPTTSDASPLHTHPDHPQRNVDCPTCAPYVAVLAKEVAYSHHTNSSIVCRISGEVIGDENYALAFPNGYVYSHKALSQMAKETVGGIVTCPRTGEQCPFDQLRRVYIL